MLSSSGSKYQNISTKSRQSSRRIERLNASKENNQISRQATVVVGGKRRTENSIQPFLELPAWDHSYSEETVTFSTKPVYVERSPQGDTLIYNAKRMLRNKLYEVEWDGKKIGLLKTNKQEIILYESVEK